VIQVDVLNKFYNRFSGRFKAISSIFIRITPRTRKPTLTILILTYEGQ